MQNCCRESSICIKFTSSVEGVSGEHLGMKDLQSFIKAEPANRHQVVGVQIVVGAKCGYRKKPSQKSIVYKTEYHRESSLGHKFKHTKEYDVQDLGKAGAGDMNSPSINISKAAEPPPNPFESTAPGGDDSFRMPPMRDSFGSISGLGNTLGSMGLGMVGEAHETV